MDVPADNHVAKPHVHVDHQYLVMADNLEPVGAAAHPFVWYTVEELAGLSMFEDTRSLVLVLFSCVDALAQGRLSVGGEVVEPFLAAAG
ncbi:MAG: hypothetical protein GEV03_24605 [Streptosporangiales bacterium]|nr:hypothetical protein [Streptosporangiales bacterium]